MEKLAHALKLPIETLYRAAGILPTPEDWSPSQSEWDAIFGELSEADQEEMLAIARMKLERKRGSMGGAAAVKAAKV